MVSIYPNHFNKNVFNSRYIRLNEHEKCALIFKGADLKENYQAYKFNIKIK